MASTIRMYHINNFDWSINCVNILILESDAKTKAVLARNEHYLNVHSIKRYSICCIECLTGSRPLPGNGIKRDFGISQSFLSGIISNFGNVKYMYGTSLRKVGRYVYDLLLELC